MPVQAQREIKTASQALPARDAETDKLYRDSWANMVRMLKKMYDGGVEIVAGTDQGNGYALHRELEIYNGADQWVKAHDSARRNVTCLIRNFR